MKMNNSACNVKPPVTEAEYGKAFGVLFPTLDKLKELLGTDGEKHLADLMNCYDIMLRYHTAKSYQEGFADGKSLRKTFN